MPPEQGCTLAAHAATALPDEVCLRQPWFPYATAVTLRLRPERDPLSPLRVGVWIRSFLDRCHILAIGWS
jgi:hypothetical protein